VEVFKSLLPLAHPKGDSPSWLEPAIGDLSQKLDRVKKIRRELDHTAEAASSREVEMKEARLRIGRALDELGRDESRLLNQMKELEPRRDEAQARLDELAKPLLKAWGAIPPMPADHPALERELVEALRDAGHLAAIWIEAERSVVAFERDLEDRRREHEDLRFQISQLKGRLGTLNADSELDLGDMRGKTSKLDAEIRALVDELMEGAEPVMKHFMGFAELRDAVLTGDLSVAQTVA
jgi:chromosome segregation ATPase